MRFPKFVYSAAMILLITAFFCSLRLLFPRDLPRSPITKEPTHHVEVEPSHENINPNINPNNAKMPERFVGVVPRLLKDVPQGETVEISIYWICVDLEGGVWLESSAYEMEKGLRNKAEVTKSGDGYSVVVVLRSSEKFWTPSKPRQYFLDREYFPVTKIEFKENED